MPKLELYDADSNDDYLNTSSNSLSEIEYFKSEKKLKKRLSKVASRTLNKNYDDETNEYDNDGTFDDFNERDKFVSSSFSSNSSFNSYSNMNKTSYKHNRHYDLINSGSKLSKNDLNKIYSELNDIHSKLVDEYKIFKRKEEELTRREQKLRQDEECLSILTNMDSKLRFEKIKSKYDLEIENIKEEIKKKANENKRLSESFKVCKESNENLKQQLNEKQERINKLERQNQSLKSRLANLNKKSDANENDKSQQSIGDQISLKPSTNLVVQNNQPPHQQPQQSQPTYSALKRSSSFNTSTQQSNTNNQIFEAFAISLEWLNQTYLKEKLDFNLPLKNDLNILDKLQKILPTLAELLISLNNNVPNSTILNLFKKYNLILLEFIYWSLLHFDFSFQNQKVNLSSTFRRIGEELYKSLNYISSLNESSLVKSSATESNTSLTTTKPSNKPAFSALLEPDDSKTRLLSSLIVLRTLNQIDHISQIFEIIREDLKEDERKEQFLNYHGTWTILKWCKLGNQILLSLSIDVYLLLSVEWKLINKFLESCSNESWFSQISILLRNSNVSNNSSTQTSSNNNLDLKIIEKMSILLQKLSKIKSNKRYFEMFSLNRICNDLLKRFSVESDFLNMNLKSILFNLNDHQQMQTSLIKK